MACRWPSNWLQRGLTRLRVGEIDRELNESLRFLAADTAALPVRHRSMAAAFDSSWQRLSQNEQQIFARLSVFRGGFRREAAEQVAGASLRDLNGLVGKSFVRFDRTHGRYDIHELLRQFAAEKLAGQAGDDHSTRDRHAAYWCETLHVRYEELKGSKQQDALSALEEDKGNLLAAWEWATTQHNLGPIGAGHGWPGAFL